VARSSRGRRFGGGLNALAGVWVDDPFLQEIVEEAYGERDREGDELLY
jgi:hypothetical protein